MVEAMRLTYINAMAVWMYVHTPPSQPVTRASPRSNHRLGTEATNFPKGKFSLGKGGKEIQTGTAGTLSVLVSVCGNC